MILGVARLSKLHGANEAEIAALLMDRYHGKGLGSELVRRLIEIAREEKIERLLADILPENYDMPRLCKKLGFRLRHDVAEHLVKGELEL